MSGYEIVLDGAFTNVRATTRDPDGVEVFATFTDAKRELISYLARRAEGYREALREGPSAAQARRAVIPPNDPYGGLSLAHGTSGWLVVNVFGEPVVEAPYRTCLDVLHDAASHTSDGPVSIRSGHPVCWCGELHRHQDHPRSAA